MKKTYGYVRVSSREQNEERQVVAMQEFGVPDNCMVIEKQSARISTVPATAVYAKRSSRATSYLSRALTGLAETIMKFWISGGI